VSNFFYLGELVRGKNAGAGQLSRGHHEILNICNYLSNLGLIFKIYFLEMLRVGTPSTLKELYLNLRWHNSNNNKPKSYSHPFYNTIVSSIRIDATA